MTASARNRSVALGVLGLTLVVAGAVAYFVILVNFGGWLPRVRNHGVPSWLLIAAGLALAALALRRAPRGRRVLPSALLGVSGLVALLFAAFLYVGLAVPFADGPAIGAPAPDFALQDQVGKTVRLADFRGKPLLLVFYRGHW